MTEKILTLRLKSQDEKTLKELMKRDRYKSKSEILREGLLLLIEREASSKLGTLSKRHKKVRRVNLDDLIKRHERYWTTKEESGTLVDSDREI